MASGRCEAIAIIWSDERRMVSVPPIANSEVVAKNAVPFCSAAMICMSTIRCSRTSMRRIQATR